MFCPSSHPVLLQRGQRLVDAVDELVDVLKVFCHLCGEHHVYDGLTQCTVLIPKERERQRGGEEKEREREEQRERSRETNRREKERERVRKKEKKRTRG